MSGDSASGSRLSALFGFAGLVTALCCIAAPAALGAAVGTPLGNALGVAAAGAVGVVAVLGIRRVRAGSDDC